MIEVRILEASQAVPFRLKASNVRKLKTSGFSTQIASIIMGRTMLLH